MARFASEDLRELPAQPMLLPYLLHFQSSDGRVLILAPKRTYQLRLPAALARVAEQVLGRMDGQRTIPQLIEVAADDQSHSQPELVIPLLQYLHKEGMLIDGAARPPEGLHDHTLARWGRNLSFFSNFERGTRTRYDYQLALQESTVVLIGLGGTGSWIAYNLAMAGVGKIVGVDGDRVAMNNLNRQILYRPKDVGRLKAEVAAETLADLVPEMEFLALARWLQGENDVAEVIQGYDIVLLAADRPMGLITRWANAACFALRIPLMELGIAAHWGIVGPLYVPGLTGCWECVVARKRRQSKYYDEMFRALAEEPVSAPPSLAPMCALVGTLVAYEAIKYLTGFARPVTLGRELTIDTTTMGVEEYIVNQRAECPVCRVPAEEMPDRAGYLPKARAGNVLSRLANAFSIRGNRGSS
jgi:bacteriocin biosynthesis cyclodehydratase domain-containing protein